MERPAGTPKQSLRLCRARRLAQRCPQKGTRVCVESVARNDLQTALLDILSLCLCGGRVLRSHAQRIQRTQQHISKCRFWIETTSVACTTVFVLCTETTCTATPFCLRLHVAAATACTRRTQPELRRAQHERTGQLHSDATRKATNCTKAWGLCGNAFALETQLRAR